MGIEGLLKEEVGQLKQSILNLIPEKGQYPFILIHQVREILPYKVTWKLMQQAFDELYKENLIYPNQDFSRSIIKRTYKSKAQS